MDDPNEIMLTQLTARSFAVRDMLAYLLAAFAQAQPDPGQEFRSASNAMQDRLDELPAGIGQLKELVRAEADWIIGAAQAFHGMKGR